MKLGSLSKSLSYKSDERILSADRVLVVDHAGIECECSGSVARAMTDDHLVNRNMNPLVI